MTPTGRSDTNASAGVDTVQAVTDAVESAGFVRLLARADGDSLAAAGVLVRALSDRETPFQVSVAASVAKRTERAADDGSPADAGSDPCGSAAESTAGSPTDSGATPARPDPTIAIGPCDAAVPTIDPLVDERPASVVACEVVREIGASFDASLALAGAFAAGVEPGAGETEWILELARDRGAVATDRRPGVAVPTADPVDGLAHSGLIAAPWSGDVDGVRDGFPGVEQFDAEADGEDEVDDEDESDDQADPAGPDGDNTADGGEDVGRADADDDERRRIGSLAALDAVGAPDASEAAATSIARVLRPLEAQSSPFATVGGYADVLDAAAREEPGTGVALAMGHGAREAALSAWREHGRRVHDALGAATVGRYDGFAVVELDEGDGSPLGPPALETVARLAVDYRSPEPVTLAVGANGVGVATAGDGREAGPLLERLARAMDATHDVGPRVGSIRAVGDSDESRRGDGENPVLDADAVTDAAREVIDP